MYPNKRCCLGNDRPTVILCVPAASSQSTSSPCLPKINQCPQPIQVSNPQSTNPQFSNPVTCPQPICPDPICPVPSCPSCPVCPSCSVNCPQPACVTCPSTTVPSSTVPLASTTIPWIGDSTPPTTAATIAPAPSNQSSTPAPAPPPPPPPPPSARQYTSNHTSAPLLGGKPYIDYLNQLEKPNLINHGIYGTTKITPQQLQAATWNGTPIDPVGKTNQELCDTFFPGGVMIGLEDLYNNTKPFQDEENPTMAEIDNWNLKVFQHFRAITGGIPIEADYSLFLTSQWGDERWATDLWDTKYPNNVCTPKRDMSRQHCGVGFWPRDCQDQQPYLLSGDPCVTNGTSEEGIAYLEADIPWAHKIARSVLARYVCAEGMTGHGAPMFGGITKIGWHIMDTDLGWRVLPKIRLQYRF